MVVSGRGVEGHVRRGPGAELDYYLVGMGGGAVAGVVVEEFVLTGDHTAAGVDSAGWSAEDGAWWSSAAFCRAMRVDAELRARVVPAGRAEAADAYRRLGGGELPDEGTLRTYFRDRAALPCSAPLLFDTPLVPDGFRELRVYRVLFAKELGREGLARLRAAWRMDASGPGNPHGRMDAFGPGDPHGRVAGTARLRAGSDLFTWELRSIGPGVAWCLDLTACLGGESAGAVGPLLRELTAGVRREGLIPVTVERLT
ncbi:hypothetical protein Ssi03_40830 [Sphaerisporangium siamense]|uniref:Uncharacterized protein n=1 Tax=Sphaerisporangium siamense TaxID=795645 RepID=A0A7W7GAX5_9ACTN|nr:hypothetical protein [Sphaerisporangium siamense]MBB4704483.1 hypothetical protein [Sphaerisporangium siamense]GII86093.1 hypothetical protein Ssi03_40830 [Sphaerisporangium siamense]